MDSTISNYLQRIIIEYCWQLKLYGGVKVYANHQLFKLALVSKQWLRYSIQFYNKYLEIQFNPYMSKAQDYLKHSQDPYCLLKSFSKLHLHWYASHNTLSVENKSGSGSNGEKSLDMNRINQLPLHLITSILIDEGFYGGVELAQGIVHALETKQKERAKQKELILEKRLKSLKVSTGGTSYQPSEEELDQMILDEESVIYIPQLRELDIRNSYPIATLRDIMEKDNKTYLFESLTSLTVTTKIQDLTSLLPYTPQLKELKFYCRVGTVTEKDILLLPSSLELISSPFNWCNLLVKFRKPESFPRLKKWIVSGLIDTSLDKTYFTFLNHFKSIENGLLPMTNLIQNEFVVDRDITLCNVFQNRPNIYDWTIIFAATTIQLPNLFIDGRTTTKLSLGLIPEMDFVNNIPQFPKLKELIVSVKIVEGDATPFIHSLQDYLTKINPTHLEYLSVQIQWLPIKQYSKFLIHTMNLMSLLSAINNHANLKKIEFHSDHYKLPISSLKTNFTNSYNVHSFLRKI